MRNFKKFKFIREILKNDGENSEKLRNINDP